MSEPFIGEIRMVGFDYPPRGWALCNGQLLSIAEYSALFALLGTTYGGDGQVTFGLPDLRGRAPLHQGQGPGLTNRVLGEKSGTESVTLVVSQMPAHTHLLTANGQAGSTPLPTNNFIAASTDAAGGENSAFAATHDTVLNPQSIGQTGSNQPHQNMQPYLCVNFAIALFGIFPSRN